MFSEMIAAIHDNRLPDPVLLRKRFEFALTKKLGIIKLPRVFWMGDPKINPPSDHLFWAALLLRDRQQIELVLSIIAVELAGNSSPADADCRPGVEDKAKKLVRELLDQFSDPDIRQHFSRSLSGITDEWLPGASEKPR